MQIGPECYPCYLNQAISAFKYGKAERGDMPRLLGEVAAGIRDLPWDTTPAYSSTLVLRHAYALLGNDDPYLEARRESNVIAMGLAQKMAARIQNEGDRLLACLRLAAAGNVVDLGIMREGYDLEGALEEALSARFDPGTYAEFVNRLERAQKILIIGDNSGEIAFDVLLADHLRQRGLKVFFSVKSFPILNDAVLEDALQVGMDRVAEVVENGNGFLGTVWSECSEGFKKIFTEADVVLAKGQANYESLEGTTQAGDKTFFLLRIKCPYLAEYTGQRLWDWVLMKNECGLVPARNKKEALRPPR